jgi:hypothetical protein
LQLRRGATIAKRRRRSRIHESVSAGFNNREAMKMVNSVPVLLLGIAIISTVGSVFGYLLEPGRFEKRGAAELAVNRSGAQAQVQTSAHSLAA